MSDLQISEKVNYELYVRNSLSIASYRFCLQICSGWLTRI